MKQKTISEVLNIPVGTVKWHLHEAKKELKKGMEKMRKQGKLSFNPVELVNKGHNGSPGEKGETSDFIRSTLIENIVYTAYKKPKTIYEIAEELGTPPPFIEDEVKYLTEFGFMTEKRKGAYQTNFII